MTQPKKKHLKYNRIEKIRKRYFWYSTLNLFFIVILAITGLVYYAKTIDKLSVLEEADFKVDQQLRYINDIIILLSLKPTKKRNIELDEKIDHFSRLEKSFLIFLEKNKNYPVIRSIDHKLVQSTLEDKVDNFQNKTEEFLSHEVNEMGAKEKKRVKVFLKTSDKGFQKYYFLIQNQLRNELKKSHDMVMIVEASLIIISIIVSGLSWLYLFKPMYETVNEKQSELIQSLLKADQASRLKTNFLANISHEIRTPMTAILGYANIMKNHQMTDEEQKEAIAIINHNASHLLSLIDELLDISKIEAGKLTLKKEPVDLREVLKQVFVLLSVKAEEKAINLSIESKTALPEMIYTDPKRFKQILFNILGNAIKFTEKGFVKLIICYDQNNDEIVLDICDSGQGIPEKDIKRLFKPFNQVDSSESRKHQGTGLGLALSRKLARKLKGDLFLKETSQKSGSVFGIRLRGVTEKLPADLKMIDEKFNLHDLLKKTNPLDFKNTVISQDQETIDLQKKKILVVDDAKENARLFKIYLEKANAQVSLAYDGEEALKKLEEASFALILMDLQMPKMNGFDALAHIQKRGIKTPVVALTAHATAETTLKARQHGFLDSLSKPISYKKLCLYCKKILLGPLS